MTTALILVFSFIAFLQFFMSYCRSVIAASEVQPLSEQVWEVAGIRDLPIRGEEFLRLAQLSRLCPDAGTDHRSIGAVSAYFHMLSLVRAALRGVIPGVVPWTETELSRCAHFVAVVLDRRISHSRQLMARQFSSQS